MSELTKGNRYHTWIVYDIITRDTRLRQTQHQAPKTISKAQVSLNPTPRAVIPLIHTEVLQFLYHKDRADSCQALSKFSWRTQCAQTSEQGPLSSDHATEAKCSQHTQRRPTPAL